MFVLKQYDDYTWPVPIILPTDEGKKLQFTLTATFKRPAQSRVNELLAMARIGEYDDIDVAKEVLTGWNDVVDDDGNAVPFNESTKDKFLEIHSVAGQICKAFFRSVETEEGKPGKAKNFKP